MHKDKKIIIGSNASKQCCGGQPVGCNESRRSILKMAALGVAAGIAGGSSLAWAAAETSENDEKSARPRSGDVLVSDRAGDLPEPLRIKDIEPGSPTLAFPFDPVNALTRSGSRFNKVVLLRFEESELPAEVAANAAGGVLAFSAICTHQGCEVNAWMAGDGLLACFCHGSMFDPFEGGDAVAGPAPRGLPVLPIEDREGVITVAGAFSSAPGF